MKGFNGLTSAVAIAGITALGACGGSVPNTQGTSAALGTPSLQLQEFGPYSVEPAGAPHLVAGVNVATGTWCRNVLLENHQPVGSFWFDSAGVGAAYETADGQMVADFNTFVPRRSMLTGDATLSVVGASGSFAPYGAGSIHMTWGPDPLFGPGPCDLIEHCTCHITAD